MALRQEKQRCPELWGRSPREPARQAGEAISSGKSTNSWPWILLLPWSSTSQPERSRNAGLGGAGGGRDAGGERLPFLREGPPRGAPGNPAGPQPWPPPNWSGEGAWGPEGEPSLPDGHSVAFFRKLQYPALLLSTLVYRFFFRFEFSFSWWFFSVSSSASEQLSLT